MSIKGMIRKAVNGYARSKGGGKPARHAVNRPVRGRSPKKQIVQGVVRYAKKRL